MGRFAHIEGDYPYPNTIDVNKYVNDFDYEQYDETQMIIHVCSVPWDVGLIHVGNAQIGGLGNVVYFESPIEREEWFAEHEGFTWATRYRDYHDKGYIEIPLPYERAIEYNYVWIEYNKLPVNYAGGKDKLFFFIRSCEKLSPNSTKVEILRDTWQTYVYDVDISYLMLERGHAPMGLIDANTYLANPSANNRYLLADDVSYGDSYISRFANAISLNSGDMWAVIVSSANPEGVYGTKAANTWKTPDGIALKDGQLAMFAFAIAPDKLSKFLTNANSQNPQFIQTIKAVFFIQKSLVNVSRETFTFCGIECVTISQAQTTHNLLELTKAQFGYGRRYENLAKLYTYPYSYLEIANDSGASSIIRIEETTGDLSLKVATSLAYPWLAIDAHLSGIGKGNGNITFKNVNSHSFQFDGAWYDHLHRWEIPTFAVTQSAETYNDYATHFDRLQQAAENQNALTNALANATTAKHNSDLSANTRKTIGDNNAETNKANADAAALATRDNAYDSADTSKTNSDASSNTAKTNADNIADANKTNADNISNATYTNTSNNITRIKDNVDREQTLRTALKNSNNLLITNETEVNRVKLSADAKADILASMTIVGAQNEATATTSAVNAVDTIASNAAMGAIGGTALGTIVPGAGNAAGAAVGAIGGAVSGLISAAATPFTSNISMTTNEDLALASQNNTRVKAQNAATANAALRDYRTGYNDSQNALNNQAVGEIAVRNKSVDDAQNTLTHNTELAANTLIQTTEKTNNANTLATALANNVRTRAMERGNALRSYNTETANNTRTYNNAIENNELQQNADLENNANTYDTSVAITNRNKAIADDAITNSIKQHALEAPKEFGTFSNGETSTTRPMAIFANIVTQAQDAIEQAGDYFLRFGYAVNRTWDFNGFNIMPHFTYWKASDMWISGNNVPDAYLDEIRFYLLGGVCVWRNPDDIGKISIYENN